MEPKQVKVGQRVAMRKQHPCGNNQMIITRIGMDIGFRCLKCEHSVLMPQRNFYKQLKKMLEDN